MRLGRLEHCHLQQGQCSPGEVQRSSTGLRCTFVAAQRFERGVQGIPHLGVERGTIKPTEIMQRKRKKIACEAIPPISSTQNG